MENIKNEITLTAIQKAKKKYYEKIRNTPEYKEKHKLHCKKYYENNLKYNEEYKTRISEQKREYYIRTKKEPLFEIMI